MAMESTLPTYLKRFTVKKSISTLFSLLLLPASAFAGGSAVVNWADPANYKDVRASGGSQEKFQARTFAQLAGTIQTLADTLPEGQKLEMTVSDLDLAGEVQFSGARTQYQDLRVVKEMYPAKITFHYRLLDASGRVLEEGDEKLLSRWMGASTRTGSSESLEIEKRMLGNWFKRSIVK